MYTFSKLSTLSAACALSLLASGASATTVSLTYHGASSAGDTKAVTIQKAPVSYPGTGDWPKTVGAWGFLMKDATDKLGEFLAWCLDVGSFLSASSSVERDYIITSDPFSNSYGLDSDQMQRVQSVFDANYGTLDPKVGDQAAGFQLALWDALYDNDFSVTIMTGAFWATSSSSTAISNANTYLGNAKTYAGDKAYNLTFLESDDSGGKKKFQNLVTASPVPIPAAGGLLLLGVGGLAAASRRSRKLKQS